MEKQHMTYVLRTHPPCMIGCTMPSIFVSFVDIGIGMGIRITRGFNAT